MQGPNNFILQDAAPGDSGAPLYTVGEESTDGGEVSGRILIGIHAGGDSDFVANSLKKGKLFFPKWWIRVRLCIHFTKMF